jgi:uncharacterized integral membrane protein
MQLCDGLLFDFMRNLKLISASLLAVLVAIIVVQNRDPVGTHILFWTVSMPLAILLFITSAAGFALGVLLTLSLNSRRNEDRWGRPENRFSCQNNPNNCSEQQFEYVSYECRTIKAWLADQSFPEKIGLEPEGLFQPVRVGQKLFWRRWAGRT